MPAVPTIWLAPPAWPSSTSTISSCASHSSPWWGTGGSAASSPCRILFSSFCRRAAGGLFLRGRQEAGPRRRGRAVAHGDGVERDGSIPPHRSGAELRPYLDHRERPVRAAVSGARTVSALRLGMAWSGGDHRKGAPGSEGGTTAGARGVG